MIASLSDIHPNFLSMNCTNDCGISEQFSNTEVSEYTTENYNQMHKESKLFLALWPVLHFMTRLVLDEYTIYTICTEHVFIPQDING